MAHGMACEALGQTWTPIEGHERALNARDYATRTLRPEFPPEGLNLLDRVDTAMVAAREALRGHWDNRDAPLDQQVQSLAAVNDASARLIQVVNESFQYAPAPLRAMLGTVLTDAQALLEETVRNANERTRASLGKIEDRQAARRHRRGISGAS